MSKSAAPPGRNANLDLLRALAVSMVVLYHLACLWPVQRSVVSAITRFGEYGVDLFFVLSGWLIGGLFWKEHARFGNVEVLRFIARRLIRTLPPYFAALVLSYLAVRFARGDAFDWHYLALLQNYQQKIPFFLTSWSLCVEEHFYLVMPFAAMLLIRLAPRHPRIHWGLLALAAAPLLFRALNAGAEIDGPFGYARAATHFRCEGLILGVWASFVHHCRPAAWKAARRLAPAGLAASVAVVAVVSSAPASPEYVFLYSAVVCFHFFLLLVVAEEKPLFAGASRGIYWLAATSYSLYLTHQLVIHGVLGYLQPASPAGELLALAAVAAGVVVAGLGFYLLVERTSLLLRQRYTPPRAASASKRELTGAGPRPIS